MRYPAAHSLKTSVTTETLGFSPDGRMARVTGKIAGCAPNAKMANGSTDKIPSERTMFRASVSEPPADPLASSAVFANPVADNRSANAPTMTMLALDTAASPALPPSPPTATPIGSMAPRVTAAKTAPRFGSSPGGKTLMANGDATSARMLA